MKMSISWILLVKLAFCLASTTSQSSEHLYVVENFSSQNELSKELICMTEDDDAALIWNRDLSAKEYSNHYENFEPINRTTRNSPECAIWGSEQCLVSWKKREYWAIVNSLAKPMGPVVDYRWEDFVEFVPKNVSSQKQYQNLLLLDNLDGNLVFSVRGTRDIVINLCDNEDSTTSSCFLIKLSVGGNYSAIETCLSNESSHEKHAGNQSCEVVKTFLHKNPVLDGYEWRTFRLQWISNETMIKLFNDNKEEPFLQANVLQWHIVRAVSVNSEAAARIKFHLYGYLMAKRENALLTTAEFHHPEENFCANMLVSLCMKCLLNVSLTNAENGSTIAHTVISGDKHSYPNGWRTWRSMELNMTLQSPLPTSLKLQIISAGDEDNAKEFLWAIDNLRLCNRSDGVRESVITIPISGLANNESNIKCQKLHDGQILVADLAKRKPSDDINQLRQLIRQRVKLCSSGCVISSDVQDNSTDCKCVQQFSENYEDACVDIVPGKRNVTLVQSSNSTMCGNCNGSYYIQVWEESGDKKLQEQNCSTLECTYSSELKPYTDYKVQVMCPYGAVIFKKNLKTLESAPGMIRNLTFESIFAENVTGKWESPAETNGYIRNYTVTIKRIKLIGCEDLQRISPPESESSKTVTETTVSFSGLHPYAEYNFTVIGNTVEPGPPLSVIFATHQLDYPTAKVSNLSIVNDSYISWDRPEDCTTITGPANTTALLISGVSDWAKNWEETILTDDTRYDLETDNLLPHTRYQVRAYVVRDYNNTANENNYQEVHWTTASVAPPAVRNLTIYEVNATENTMSARWEPPYPAYGEIESYQLLLLNNNSVFENRSIELSELKNCTPSYVCIENFSLPSNISTNTTDLELQIFARNANVSTDGTKTSKRFNLYDS